MSVTIELAPAAAAELARTAAARGLEVEDYLHQIVTERLHAEALESRRQKNRATIAHLQQWLDEAEAAPPEEKRRDDAQWRATMRALDEDRGSARKLFPDLAD